MKKRLLDLLQKFRTFIASHPFPSFFGLLGLLLVLIKIGNRLRQVPTQKRGTPSEPKLVQAYQTGAAPTLRVQAKIEKSGVIKLVAQTAGVVQKINKTEGQHVKRGTRLFSFSTSYQGGNIPDLTRQITARNLQFQNDTYSTQKDVIDKNRQVATKVETQASQLRSISRQSIDETNSLISLDETIIASLSAQVQNLQNLDP